MTLAQGEYGEDMVSWTVCSGLGVLRFKYLAAPTRRIVVTATGTGPTNPCPHQATGSISSLTYLQFVFVKSFACFSYLFDFTV